MKRNENSQSRLDTLLGLSSVSEKIWFWCAFALLVVYVGFVTAGQDTVYGYDLFFFHMLFFVPLCLIGVLLCSKMRFSIRPETGTGQGRLQGALLAASAAFVLTFAVLFLWQKAYWPGSFSPDSITQYAQVVTGDYVNWHPVIHTWLFFWIPYQIFHGEAAGIVTLQLVWFSLAVAYLYFILYRNNASRLFLCLSWLYLVLNPNTAYIMLFPWKDSAMGIFALVLFTQLIEIYRTDGAWLNKWYRLACLTAAAFLTMEMRRNGVLLIAPVFLILFAVLKNVRKKVLISGALVIIAHVILHGPVFMLADVELPENEVVETMGTPMTILSHVYVNDRDALSEEARDFMDSLAAPEEWEAYETGSFDSVKWINEELSAKVNAEGVGKILEYALGAAVNSPKLAWEGFAALTQVVWSVDGGNGWGLWATIFENRYGIEYHDGNALLNTELAAYAADTKQSAAKYLFYYTGIVILLLLFTAVGKLGNGNLPRALMALAPMAYDFGTMLLLSGPEFRFFHFNFLIVIPLLYLLTAQASCAGRQEDETKEIGVTVETAGEKITGAGTAARGTEG